jgi:radical SAM superfamily enzyme YgiQ (UPF0313 family)
MTLWHERTRAQAILAREVGYVRKPFGNRLRVALLFPNTYYVGMSSLGFQAVYRLFNDRDDVVCERAFLPPRQALAEMLARRTPLLTLESQTPVGELDVVAFSVSFEWDYTNLLTLLRLAGLPLYAAERSPRHPLVVVGGAVTFLNPEPLAPFADVVAVGEGEALVPALVGAARGATDRPTLLRRLASEAGFYVPSMVDVAYDEGGLIARYTPGDDAVRLPVPRAALSGAEAIDPPATSVFTPDTEFGSRFLVEVVRGCPNLCRFCWAGYNYLPVRPFAADRILEAARRARAYADRVGLVSIALCDHPEIERLLAGLVKMGYSISPASLRLDDLTGPIVELLHASGEQTLTIAPETGSDRLRAVINKAMTNDAIVERADAIFESGVQNLKLYFMIGLPTETDEDIVAIRDLTLRIRERMMAHARGRRRVGRLIGSVNPLIPKPGTAFQWAAMEDASSTERKMKRLRGLVSGLDNVYFTVKSERHSVYQALLSLGDRRIAPVVELAERNGGRWRAATDEAGLDVDRYVFRDRSGDAVLPWDVIQGGVPAAFLRAEAGRAMHGEWTTRRSVSR